MSTERQHAQETLQELDEKLEAAMAGFVNMSDAPLIELDNINNFVEMKDDLDMSAEDNKPRQRQKGQ